MPETVSYLFLHCQHPAICSVRETTRSKLRSLALRVSDIVVDSPQSPDFDDDIAFYSVLQLCTGVGQTHHRQACVAADQQSAYTLTVLRPMHMVTRSRSHACQRGMMEQRKDHVFIMDPSRMRAAVAWSSFLTNLWRQFVGNDRADAQAASLGRELVDIVTKFSQSLFTARRRALVNDTHFLSRDRDPPEAVPLAQHHVSSDT